MYQILMPYPYTDKASITVVGDVPIATVTPAGRVGILLGKANVVGGGLLMHNVERAVHSLLSRVHNTSKGQAAVRVESYHNESDAVFHNNGGLSNESFAAACFVLADPDQASSTELLSSAFAKLVAVAREVINSKASLIKP